MANRLYSTVKKLQLALCQKGVKVKVNQQQYFSKKTGKPTSMYVAIKTEVVNGRIKNTTICETPVLVDVVRALANLLKEESDGA